MGTTCGHWDVQPYQGKDPGDLCRARGKSCTCLSQRVKFSVYSLKSKLNSEQPSTGRESGLALLPKPLFVRLGVGYFENFELQQACGCFDFGYLPLFFS